MTRSIDYLYFVYLAFMSLLAILRWPSPAFLINTHVLIATAILLLAANSHRLALVRFLHDWYPLLMFIFCFEEVARFSLTLVPHWQDGLLMRLEDHVFGISPNLWLGRFNSRWLSELMDAGYFSYYPLFPIVAGMLYIRPEKRPFRELMLSAVLMYSLCFGFYLLFPTEGPRHTVSALAAPPHGAAFNWMVRTIQHQAGVHGNAFPSGHVGLAFLCAAFAWRYLQKAAPLVTLSLILICLSAVYDGYHYASDVAGGIAVALAGFCLCRAVPAANAPNNPAF